MLTKVINALSLYVNQLILPFATTTSVFGFTILVTILLQLLSGFFLAWYYIPEPGLVIELREEMFEETKYGYEVFNLHVRGVDVIFVLSYFHILKKLFLKNYITADSEA
jgi:quinol-cytochrome oxidoreductase complex cytochrome b subunit